MDLLGSNIIPGEVGLRLLLSPLGSNIVTRTACCSVGIALPVYSTFKAIESKNQEAQQTCLIYWAAYGSFSLVEVFTDKLISWVPMYYQLKFAFLVWLQLPPSYGAKQLYFNHLRPFFLRNQTRADNVLGLAYCEVIKLVDSYKPEIKFARSIVVKITKSADQMLRGATTTSTASDRSLQNSSTEGPASDRLLQNSSAEDPAALSDAEPDQNNS